MAKQAMLFWLKVAIKSPYSPQNLLGYELKLPVKKDYKILTVTKFCLYPISGYYTGNV